ncbi:MAG: Lrp/AsnC family transcriptional regulator [Nanoarchaeota archaeon]|nr:Lrp/AsnC family transcriptional regulator [Nanoarchaeota archaeon]
MHAGNIKLDEKDRKILAELDRNARQTDSEIAKKTGISKQVANYRIQRLKEQGIISNFYTLVNVGALGLNTYYVFFQFQGINKEKERALLDKINSLNYVGWLISGTGRWDAAVLIYADSTGTFDRLLNEVINLCGDNLHEYNFTTMVSAEHISYKFLEKTGGTGSVKQTEKAGTIKLDEKDKKILECISQNARLPITDIAAKTGLPLHIVNYHLKSLIKRKIIEGFKPKINVNKLGYQWHLLLIQLQRTSEARKREFMSFCKQYKRIYYVTNTVGLYNIMLDIHVNSAEEFKEVLLELKDKFSDIIKLYESMIIFDEHKISYVPKALI